METTEDGNPKSKFLFYLHRHRKGLIICFLPLLFIILMFINDDYANRVLYLLIIMIICWITDVFPMPITAMFPVVAMPLMNIMESNKTCSMYFRDTLLMFLICTLVMGTMEFTKLHMRIALHICKMNSGSVKGIHTCIGIIGYLLSIFVPNAACISIMIPVTSAILDILATVGICKKYEDDDSGDPNAERKPSRVAVCYFLTLAYTISIGGTAAIFSSPMFYVVKDIYESRFPDSPDAFEVETAWTGIPFAIILGQITILIMQITHLGLFRKNSEDAMSVTLNPENKSTMVNSIHEKLSDMGKMTLGQCFTATFIVVMLLLMFTRKPYLFPSWADAMSDKEIGYTSIACLMIYLIFAFPGNFHFFKCWDEQSSVKTPGLVNWKFLNQYTPWEIIFLIGCGGTLAEGSRISGLARSTGDFLTGLSSLPGPLSLFLAMLFTLLCTNFTNNTSVMMVLMPGIIQLAVDSRYHPLYFMEAITVMGGVPFLFPTGTPSNILVWTYGNIPKMHMFIGGLIPTFVAIIGILIRIHLRTVFNSDYFKFPDWVVGTQPDYGDSK